MIQKVFAAGPGLGAAAAIAAVATLAQALGPIGVLGPMMAAMILGLAARSLLGERPALSAGSACARAPLLRFAIVLLGVRITFVDIAAIDVSGAVVIAAAVAVTFGSTLMLARLLGVPMPLGGLLAAGVSICGASAVLAAASVTRAREGETAYAVAAVTVLGTIAMLAYPLLAQPLGLAPRQYGLWTGASLHEVGQVLAAGFRFGAESGEIATIAKLARVLCLAPLILIWRALAHRGGGVPIPFPWLVFGFLAVVAVNSTLGVPPALAGALSTLASVFMTLALAALGLMTDAGQVRRAGLGPMALAGAASVIVAGVSLVAVVSLT